MKKTLLTALALAGFAATTGAYAQATYTAGNIFLGFRALSGTGAANSYVINLGNFADLSSAPLDLGSSLTTIYGNDWFTRGDVKWGIFGMPSDRTIVYSSTPSGGNAPTKKSAGSLNSPFSLYNTFGANYNTALNNGAYDGTSGTLGAGVVTGAGAGTWNANLATAADFGVYNSTLEADVATGLSFWGVTVSTQTQYNPYTLSSDGVVSAVPEPSTYAFFGLGALVLILAYRRKANA